MDWWFWWRFGGVSVVWWFRGFMFCRWKLVFVVVGCAVWCWKLVLGVDAGDVVDVVIGRCVVCIVVGVDVGVDAEFHIRRENGNIFILFSGRYVYSLYCSRWRSGWAATAVTTTAAAAMVALGGVSSIYYTRSTGK